MINLYHLPLQGDIKMSEFIKEVEKRRTFAIISHPDAGKTTLTEKFLLYGGAIQQAGTVKGKRNRKTKRNFSYFFCITI